MFQESDAGRDDALRELGRAGLDLRTRPDGDESAAERLFEVHDELLRRRANLARLVAAYEGTAADLLNEEDGRVFRRERERRQRAVDRLAKEHDELLLRYAREVVDAGSSHPRLVAMIERVTASAS